MRHPLTKAEVADRLLSERASTDAVGAALYEVALEEGLRIISDPEASCSTGRALVGVYAALHAATHKSEAEEIRSGVMFTAVASAKKLVAEKFDGDFERAVDFVAWAFQRERSSATPRRLTWKQLFGTPRYIYSDWSAKRRLQASGRLPRRES